MSLAQASSINGANERYGDIFQRLCHDDRKSHVGVMVTQREGFLKTTTLQWRRECWKALRMGRKRRDITTHESALLSMVMSHQHVIAGCGPQWYDHVESPHSVTTG
jgi:hypothetical protein